MITELMNERKYSMYQLSQESGVPYSTVHDICTDKVQLKKCSAETVYRIAKALRIPMEELLAPECEERPAFENFKSKICHEVKENGDIPFIIDLLEKDDVRKLYRRQWYRESFYLLGMLDYLSKENNVPRCTRYDKIRKCSLSEPVYPAGVIASCAAAGNDEAKRLAMRNAIPEFKRFNIVEGDIRDVI